MTLHDVQLMTSRRESRTKAVKYPSNADVLRMRTWSEMWKL